MKKLFFGENNLNGPEVFIVFKLTELSRSCSKWIIWMKYMYIHISIISINGKFFCDGEFLDHYLKSVQENVVYKESSVFKEKTNSKIKLNSEHFF